MPPSHTAHLASHYSALALATPTVRCCGVARSGGRNVAKCATEFIGTPFLARTIGMCVSINTWPFRSSERLARRLHGARWRGGGERHLGRGVQPGGRARAEPTASDNRCGGVAALLDLRRWLRRRGDCGDARLLDAGSRGCLSSSFERVGQCERLIALKTTSPRRGSGACEREVEAMRLELTTSSMPWKRSTKTELRPRSCGWQSSARGQPLGLRL